MNSSKIEAIDKTSVHRICSGQVILSLAVAVKEIIENSLDAGANIVNVRLKEYGSELLEVSDNGSGVHPDNFEGLTLKHHTSKLKDFSDLESIATFGFRGEALSSLCALSRVTISTRHSSQDVGTLITFDHSGFITSKNYVPRQVGSTVSLTGLFSTLPVRQKQFHKNLKREFTKMMALLNAYCLVSTGVKITCSNQTSSGKKTTLVSTLGCRTVEENISSIFGPSQLSHLLELRTVKPDDETLSELRVEDDAWKIFRLEGFISSCCHGRGRPTSDRQFYYINGRPCEPAKVMRVVNESYHEYNMHQQPFVYLNITVEPTCVDVNVTPDKRQVFLQHEKLLLATIKASLKKLFENIPSTLAVNNLKRPACSSESERSSDSQPSLSRFRHLSEGSGMVSSRNHLPAVHKAKQMKLDNVVRVRKGKYDVDDDNDGRHDAERNSLHNRGPGERTTGRDTDRVMNRCSIEQCTDVCGSPSETSRTDGPDPTTKSDSECPSLEVSDSVCRSALDSVIPSKTVRDINCLVRRNEFTTVESGGDNCDEVRIEVRTDETVDGSCSTDGSGGHSQVETQSEILPEAVGIRTDEGDDMPDRKTVRVDFSMEYLRRLEETNEDEERSNGFNIKFRAAIDPSKNSEAEEELSRLISKDMFPKMEIIGQFNVGFIITKLNSDLFIVDQHATDEKYNFEMLQQTTTLSNQRLVLAQNLELTAANECLLLDNIQVFKKNGFDFEIDENEEARNRVKLSAVPMSKNWIFGKEDVEELLFMLQDASAGATMCRPSRVRSMFASRACRKSVMIGTHLSRKDMRRLIDNMASIEQPWNCPHGRPTMRHLINLQLTD